MRSCLRSDAGRVKPNHFAYSLGKFNRQEINVPSFPSAVRRSPESARFSLLFIYTEGGFRFRFASVYLICIQLISDRNKIPCSAHTLARLCNRQINCIQSVRSAANEKNSILNSVQKINPNRLSLTNVWWIIVHFAFYLFKFYSETWLSCWFDNNI